MLFCARNDLGTIWERGFSIMRGKKGENEMQTSNPQGHYDSYLLRIWRGGQENKWRWMLQNIRTGEQKGFRDMETLFDFLHDAYQATVLTEFYPEPVNGNPSGNVN